MTDNVTRFKALFDGFTGSHGRYHLTGAIRPKDGKQEGKGRTVFGPPASQVWDQHLAGTGDGLGIIPLRDDDTVKFAVIDVDDYTIKLEEYAEKVAHLSVVLCRSKSNGAHLYLFFAEPLPGDYAQEKMKALAAKFNLAGCEIFPKQTRRASEKDAGNWINLPYFGPSRHALAPDGTDMSLEAFLDLAESKRITKESLDKLKAPEPEQPDTTAGSDSNGKDYVDGPGPLGDAPPCFQTIIDGGTVDGGRNKFLFNVAMYLKRKHEPDDYTEELLRVNAMLEEPLPESEVLDILKHMHKDYKYQCGVEPLKPHCNRTLCWTRRFGVPAPQQRGKRAKPTLASLGLKIEDVTEVLYDEEIWLLTVNGVLIQFDKGDDLLDLRKFRAKVMSKCRYLIPEIKYSEFLELMKPLVEGAKPEEVADDPLSQLALFDQYLRKWISRLQQSDDVEYINKGSPFRNGDRVKFRLFDFNKNLKDERAKFEPNVVQHYLKQNYSAEYGTLDVKGTKCDYVDILLTEIQNAEYKVPDVPEQFGQ